MTRQELALGLLIGAGIVVLLAVFLAYRNPLFGIYLESFALC